MKEDVIAGKDWLKFPKRFLFRPIAALDVESTEGGRKRGRGYRRKTSKQTDSLQTDQKD